MSEKLFPMGRAAARAAVLLAAVAASVAGGCRQKRGVLTPPGVAVDNALQGQRFAEGFRKLGRAHLRSTVHLVAGLDGGATDNVTTDSDIWMDDQGNWRLVDLNDKDGGREIVLHGHELAIALRYGRMIRRPAEDPEPLRLLAQGVGGPYAAWDLLRDVSTVDDFGTDTYQGRKVHVYKLTRSVHPAAPLTKLDGGDRQAWRKTLVAEKVDGTIMIDEQLGIPLLAQIHGAYTMRRADAGQGKEPGEGTPMHGAVDAQTSIEEIGSSPVIAEPEADDLAPRQRTIPDERAMLGGLPRAPARPHGARD